MKTTNYKRISSIDDLMASLQSGEWHAFFINLGGMRSSKDIRLVKPNHVIVFNNIDDTMQTLTLKQLSTRSNIGQAITGGNFYAY